MVQKLIQAVTLSCTMLLSCAAFAAKGPSELEQMFVWWNDAMATPGGFTADGFRQYFTEDAVIRINGETRVRGIDEMLENFRRIQDTTDSVVIVLPFIEEFREGDRIFTYHESHAVIDGRQENDLVMGYVELREGKISLVNFLNHQPWKTPH